MSNQLQQIGKRGTSDMKMHVCFVQHDGKAITYKRKAQKGYHNLLAMNKVGVCAKRIKRD
jgi:hypothetical protein